MKAGIVNIYLAEPRMYIWLPGEVPGVIEIISVDKLQVVITLRSNNMVFVKVPEASVIVQIIFIK